MDKSNSSSCRCCVQYTHTSMYHSSKYSYEYEYTAVTTTQAYYKYPPGYVQYSSYTASKSGGRRNRPSKQRVIERATRRAIILQQYASTVRGTYICYQVQYYARYIDKTRATALVGAVFNTRTPVCMTAVYFNTSSYCGHYASVL